MDICSVENLMPLVPKGPLLEQVEEEDWGKWLTQVANFTWKVASYENGGNKLISKITGRICCVV